MSFFDILIKVSPSNAGFPLAFKISPDLFVATALSRLKAKPPLRLNILEVPGLSVNGWGSTVKIQKPSGSIYMHICLSVFQFH